MGAPEANVGETELLLRRAAEGDQHAHDAAISRSANRLLHLARRMLRGYPELRRWEQTDDVFQNAAIRFSRSLKKLKPETARQFYGLATLEIRRTLIDLCRHHFGPHGAAAKYQSDVKAAHQSLGILRNEADPEASDEMELWTQFHEAVEQLPDAEREVTHLVWYGGMKQAEVASILGVSVPTIKRRWYRARIQLQAMLDGQVPPAEE